MGEHLSTKRVKRQGTFELVSEFGPAGDQPQAIQALVQGLEQGERHQCLLGSDRVWKDLHHGKCHPGVEPACVDNGAEQDARCPTLRRVPGIVSENAVEYFVSYYDYYQPEAYVPPPTPISPRMRASMRRSTACAMRRLVRF